MHYSLRMTAHIYNRGQMVIPAKARKEACISEGDVVSVQIQGDGRLLLVRLEIPKPALPENARLIQRKGTHPVIKGARQPTEQELKEALADFP